jgi:hypothetical protein
MARGGAVVLEVIQRRRYRPFTPWRNAKLVLFNRAMAARRPVPSARALPLIAALVACRLMLLSTPAWAATGAAIQKTGGADGQVSHQPNFDYLPAAS